MSLIVSEVDDTSILRTGLPRLYACPLNWLPASVSCPAQRAGAQRLCALALSKRLTPPLNGQLAGVKLTLPGKVRISVADPTPTSRAAERYDLDKPPLGPEGIARAVGNQ